MSTHSISLKINDFEGPLDLLLHLVQSYKVDIFDVPLVPVIEQYLDFLALARQLNLELAGDYMLMASQLMLIKSRRLLPTVSDDFVEDTEQMEQDLLNQIADYQQLKEAADQLFDLHERRTKFYSKPKTALANPDPHLIHDTNSIDLFLAFSQVLRQRQIEDGANHTPLIEGEVFKIEDKMLEISDRLTSESQIKFTDLVKIATSRDELVTTFLALLELVKNQVLWLFQPQPFGDIFLSPYE